MKILPLVFLIFMLSCNNTDTTSTEIRDSIGTSDTSTMKSINNIPDNTRVDSSTTQQHASDSTGMNRQMQTPAIDTGRKMPR